MTEWIPATSGIITADVIRWKEPVWEKRGSRRRKPLRMAERVVTAEVLAGPDKDDWVRLLVRQCEVRAKNTVRDIGGLISGTEIRRNKTTILRGEPERLIWSDESARAAIVRDMRSSREITPDLS